MTRAGASAVRVFGGVALLALLSASGCGEANRSDGAPGPRLQRWCDAYQVINCSCQQCHQDPTRHGAAMPLMTYEDTQRPFPRLDSPKKVWQQMEQSVRNGSMPFTADTSIVPPVQALTTAQRETLLAWLTEGAHDEGGTLCSASCSWP